MQVLCCVNKINCLHLYIFPFISAGNVLLTEDGTVKLGKLVICKCLIALNFFYRAQYNPAKSTLHFYQHLLVPSCSQGG